MTTYAVLTSHRRETGEDVVRHILTGSDGSDVEALMDKGQYLAELEHGRASAVMCINTSNMDGFKASMEHVTHDLNGRPV